MSCTCEYKKDGSLVICAKCLPTLEDIAWEAMRAATRLDGFLTEVTVEGEEDE